MEVLHFLIKNTYACIDLKNIKQIILLPLLEPVPGSKYYLAGLLNLEGTSVPVIDLGLRLQLTKTDPYTIDTPVILCKQNSHQIGFIVGKIFGLSSVEESEFQTKDELKNSVDYLGTISFENKLSLLINVDHLIQDQVI